MKLVVTVFAALLSSYAFAQSLSQQQLEEFARDAELKFGMKQNFGEDGVKAIFDLDNQSRIALPKGAADWKIYFHSIRGIKQEELSGLEFKKIQGDLYEVSPTANFAGLAAGQSLRVEYTPGGVMVSYSDFMPRAFITGKGLQPVIFASTDTEDLKRYVVPFERTEQLQRSADKDKFPVVTSQSRYEMNTKVNQLAPPAADVNQRIIPTPKSVSYRKGTAVVDGSWQIRYTGSLATEAAYLQSRLQTSLGASLVSEPDHIAADGKVIELKIAAPSANRQTALPEVAESYTLDISENGIVINGRDGAGAFYGLQSLLNLIPAGTASSYSLPQLTVVDSPRAEWRGMHYDMGRNFHGKEVTLQLIEQMARYKMNKLHLHLTEDEGWRLEIPGLPELTEIGAFRCFDLEEQRCLLTQLGTGPFKSGSGNGYYSVDDFVEILKFAAERHIEVIPEIDMPGHARAAVKSMEARYKKYLAAGDKAAAEQYLLSDPLDKSEYISVQNYTDNSINVCLPSTYRFVDKVVYELQQMYRKAGQRLTIFHMGGDETGAGSWEKSPACHALFGTVPGVAGPADLKPYFVGKVAALTHKRGLALFGWEDGLMYDAVNTFNRDELANPRVLVNAWDNVWELKVADRSHRLANAGYEVVLSHATHLYFDHPHEVHPEERGYYWASRYTDAAKVFGYMPDNNFANADTTRDGVPVDNFEAMVGRAMPALEKPENILGIQGQLWSETVRTASQFEQLVYPRLIPLAERAWHKAAWEGDKPDTAARDKSWASFAQTIALKEMPVMAQAGVDFYLPPPGAIRQNGKLLANTAFPGLEIEYSLDNGNNWRSWHEMTVVESGKVMMRSRTGNTISRPTLVE